MKIEIRYPYGRGIKITFAMFPPIERSSIVNRMLKKFHLHFFRYKPLLYNHINTNFTSKKVYRAEHAECAETRSTF